LSLTPFDRGGTKSARDSSPVIPATRPRGQKALPHFPCGSLPSVYPCAPCDIFEKTLDKFHARINVKRHHHSIVSSRVSEKVCPSLFGLPRFRKCGGKGPVWSASAHSKRQVLPYSFRLTYLLWLKLKLSQATSRPCRTACNLGGIPLRTETARSQYPQSLC